MSRAIHNHSNAEVRFRKGHCVDKNKPRCEGDRARNNAPRGKCLMGTSRRVGYLCGVSCPGRRAQFLAISETVPPISVRPSKIDLTPLGSHRSHNLSLPVRHPPAPHPCQSHPTLTGDLSSSVPSRLPVVPIKGDVTHFFNV